MSVTTNDNNVSVEQNQAPTVDGKLDTTNATPAMPVRTGPKRKRPFMRSKQPTQAKRAKATFDKSEVAKHVAFTAVIYTAYDIESSFRGLFDLCNIFYTILTNRDQKISALLSANHFIYVTLLSSIYRCSLIASRSTTIMIRDLSYLKETVQDLLLPDILCQYVETFGYYRLASEAVIIPFIRNYKVMKEQSLDFIDPASILDRMDRQDPGTDWAIDDVVVLEYKRAISRVLKNAVQLRLVNNHELEAKPAFAAAFKDLGNGRIQPLAFEKMSQAECTLGAVLKFRNMAAQPEWDGFFKPPAVQETLAVSSNTYITDYILHHLKGESSFK